MTKREAIDLIRRINPTAQPDFLADFQQEDLLAYLHQLQEVERDRYMHGDLQPSERVLVECE